METEITKELKGVSIDQHNLQININLRTCLQYVKVFVIALLIMVNVSAVSPETSKVSILNQTEVKYPDLVRQRVMSKLVKEVDTYIKSVAPRSKLEAEYLVKACVKDTIDIKLVLAQGLMESHFGTTGRAITTNSVFSVGAWDKRTITKYKYKHPNESVKPYLELIKNDYLVAGRKVSDLLRDRGFKNYEGYRYASSFSYETSLRTVIVEITTKTSIAMYQDIINLSDQEINDFFGQPESNKTDNKYYSYLQIDKK